MDRVRTGFCAFAFVLSMASAALAEPQLCRDCFLSVYDDVALTQSTGRVSSFQVKTVYLGVSLPADVRVSRLDFSASYPSGFTLVDVQPLISGAVYDNAGNTAFVEWGACVSGARALFRVRILTTSTPRNALLSLQNAVALACPGSPVESWTIPSGCYVLNPTGTAPPCTTPVLESAWSGVKELFRTIDSR